MQMQWIYKHAPIIRASVYSSLQLLGLESNKKTWWSIRESFRVPNQMIGCRIIKSFMCLYLPNANIMFTLFKCCHVANWPVGKNVLLESSPGIMAAEVSLKLHWDRLLLLCSLDFAIGEKEKKKSRKSWFDSWPCHVTERVGRNTT